MNTALTVRESTLPSQSELAVMMSLANEFLKSGLLPNTIKSPSAAVLIIQKGQELRIPPAYALSNIVVIQGKPTANAELMLSLIYRDHGDNAIQFEETTATRCCISYARRHADKRNVYLFTIEDAQKAGLLSNQTWQKYPAAMLRARCISAVARFAFPDSIAGMYTPEELGASVNEDGDVIGSTSNFERDRRIWTDVAESDPNAASTDSFQPMPQIATSAAETANETRKGATQTIDTTTGEIHSYVPGEWARAEAIRARFRDSTQTGDTSTISADDADDLAMVLFDHTKSHDAGRAIVAYLCGKTVTYEQLSRVEMEKLLDLVNSPKADQFLSVLTPAAEAWNAANPHKDNAAPTLAERLFIDDTPPADTESVPF